MREQLKSVISNKPYLITVISQLLFGITLYGRNANLLYYFTYIEGSKSLFSTYSLFTIIPSILGAACFPIVFNWTRNKGKAAAIFAFLTGIAMFSLYFFSAVNTPIYFYTLSCFAQFFFSGFNTAIYAIIPDCVEYGEWKTGLRNDGFQYAFISLGNKIGMALGTAILTMVLGKAGYIANKIQNPKVISIIKHCFSTVPGILWIITEITLMFYQLNKDQYARLIIDIKLKKGRKF